MTTENNVAGIPRNLEGMALVSGMQPVKKHRPSEFYHAFVEVSKELAHRLHLGHSDVHREAIPHQEAVRLEKWYHRGNLDHVIRGLRSSSGYDAYKNEVISDPVAIVDNFKAVKEKLIKTYAREISLIRAYFPEKVQHEKIELLKSAFIDVKAGALSLLSVKYMDEYLKPSAESYKIERAALNKLKKAERANLTEKRDAMGFKVVEVPDRETYMRLYCGKSL